MQGRDGPPDDFREHGGEDQMIISTQDDDFGPLWQQSLEALRQGHSGKAPANYHDFFRNFWRGGC
jgi:hypothetical protein